MGFIATAALAVIIAAWTIMLLICTCALAAIANRLDELEKRVGALRNRDWGD